MEVLVRKFRAAGSVCAAYIVASVTLHAVWLLEKWADPESVSTPMLIFLFTLQRCCKFILIIEIMFTNLDFLTEEENRFNLTFYYY